MPTRKNVLRIFFLLVTALLQLFMIQVVTFVVTLPIPDMENFPQNHSGIFVLILGITFSTGVFLAGWLALKLGWLASAPRYTARLAATLVGAYVPLIAALILYHPLEPGNPFFFVSIVTCVLGFHLLGWAQ
jgi:hypothetical protein